MSLLVLHEGDDVAVATRALPGGASVPVPGAGEVTLRGDLPAGHKVALRDLPAGALVRKYGQVIGRTLTAVSAGEHVHLHNLGMPADAPVRAAEAGWRSAPRLPGDLRRTFHGYRRPDGRVGTRNYVGVLTTVNCSATVARKVARLTEELAEDVDGVDGVVALTHGTGCGMADRGQGWELLRRTLAGYARHPNIGGLVVVGLGCEVNTVAGLMRDLGVAEQVPVASYTIQELGGTASAVRRGVELVGDLVGDLAGAARTEVDVAELVLGLQCGGSDGWSGLTANPALGVASDLLVAAGATSVLGETPEVYGAEHLLAARAAGAAVADALLARIHWWEEYTRQQGTTLDANPSPGNKAGGITTILEKSLGAVAKAGHSPLVAVREYGEQIPRPGLVFMDTPGYDPVSVTGMVAGGANLICFTTGRGSVFGSRPVPTVKLATNAELAARMAGDVDLDCSAVVEQGVPMAEMGRRVYDLLLDVASGRRTASEELGLGGEEIVPWQLGAVL
ncbi:altronate dehydratase family protein [Micromonospora sp. NPDC050686]|uniref:UxaA family hydrolase n=1 Tax=Micromonospora sp. NPDC050686 TaxID=3154631 RepID=UPI0033FD6F73